MKPRKLVDYELAKHLGFVLLPFSRPSDFKPQRLSWGILSIQQYPDGIAPR